MNDFADSQITPHRRKHEVTIGSWVSHPFWGFTQGILSFLILILMGIATWYLTSVNRKLEDLATTQTAEQMLRAKLEFEVSALKERVAASEQRGAVLRDNVSKVETYQKILEDRIARSRQP